jgi:hypothetical protein
MRAGLSRLTLWIVAAGVSFLISLAARPAEADLFVSRMPVRCWNTTGRAERLKKLSSLRGAAGYLVLRF